MAVGAHSYGSAAQVALLASVWTNAGVFDTTTRPTLAAVETYIDQISATVNIALKAQGFTIPVIQADAVMAITSIVVQIVVDLCHAANSSGRFFSDRYISSGSNMWRSVRTEIYGWVDENAAGLEHLGAARDESIEGGVGAMLIDTSGDDIPPIFQRDAFGNSFRDWSK